MTSTTKQLAELPELAALVFTAWGAPFRPQEEATHKPIAGPRVPIDLDAFDALRPDEHGLLFELSQAVRATAEHLRDHGYQWGELTNPPTWTSETEWLTKHAVAWQADDYLSEYVPDQVRHVYKALKATLREREAFTPCCPDCGNQLAAMDGGSWYACRACGRDHTIDAQLRELGKIKHATLVELATMIERPLSTLKEWVQRGWLESVAKGPGGKRYPIEDARNLSEMLTRGRKYSHGTTAV